MEGNIQVHKTGYRLQLNLVPTTYKLVIQVLEPIYSGARDRQTSPEPPPLTCTYACFTFKQYVI
jgi:hypothetical protein